MKKHYYVTYDNAKGNKSTMIVEARSEKEALKNAENLCWTGSNFRSPEETTPAETFGEKRRREGYGIENLIQRAVKEAEKIGWKNVFDISANEYRAEIMCYNTPENHLMTWRKYSEDKDAVRFSKNDINVIISKNLRK
jgi:hypothetical protein